MAEAQKTPLVVIPGFGQTMLSLYEGNEKKSTLWPPALAADTLINKMRGPLMKMMLMRRDMGFTDTAVSLLREQTEPLTVMPTGRMRYDVRAAAEKGMLGKNFPPEELKELYGEEIHIFGYNFLLSPLDSAGKLDAFLREKGIEKADFLTLNFGANVLLAYIKQSGGEKINKGVLLSPSFDGLSFIADVYENEIGAEAVSRLLEERGGRTGESLRGLLPMLPEGVFDVLIQKLIRAALSDVLLGAAGIWATLPEEKIPSLLQKYLSSEVYSELKTKINGFQEIRSCRDRILTDRITLADKEASKPDDADFRRAAALLRAQ